MTFNTMILPNTAKKEDETNAETFLRVMDTFMGEYAVETIPFTYDALGEWVRKCNKKFTRYGFPCAWLEDEDGNITEYFVYTRTNKGKILTHQTF